MTDKEKLICYLITARSDYETSIEVSKLRFFKRRKYKSLATNKGLDEYFSKRFDLNCIVLVHLIRFKPNNIPRELTLQNLWFPVESRTGFEGRLKVINDAIEFYSNASEVPLILEGSLLEYLHFYTAYEQGITPANPISEFIEQNYDELLETERG